jgi:hypothetical protein
MKSGPDPMPGEYEDEQTKALTPIELPARLIAFIGAHIRSVDDLVLLTAMIDAPDRWWDAELVRRETGLPLRVARIALDRFASANMLDIRVTDDVRYQLRPGTGELASAIAEFAEAYRAHPATIIRVVAHAPHHIRDFADAFRIRKDDGDR